jgi:uncharacterized protein YcgL (UPF0745 family)
MQCSVFRSDLKDFTYIYLLEGQEFEDLPPPLREVFGDPVLVMQLELSPDRKLAYEDIHRVMENLAEQGFHLQLPPSEDASGWLDLPERKETLL